MAKRRPPPPPRDSQGRFLKGYSGCPEGRPKASRNKPADPAPKMRIKRGGKTRLEDPKDVILERLASSAIVDKNLASARLYMRERRLGEKAKARSAAPATTTSRSPKQTPYYEEALIALRVLKRNRLGQIVLTRSVFADLDRLYSKGEFSQRAWRAIQLAVENPQELRNRFPNKRLTITTVEQANRARAEALEAMFAEYDAMAAELAELKAKKPRR